MRRIGLTGWRPAGAAVLAVALLLAGCGDDDADDEAVPATTATPEVPVYEGDPASEFCQLSRDAADDPVLDPFAAGLEPREVEARFDALAERFARFAAVAPPPLADDLALLDQRLEQLGTVLEDADWEFTNLVGSGEALSLFDDPALADVAPRLAAYQDQVCRV